MTNIDLVSQCFFYLNSFKRHRALENIKRSDGKSEESQYHELKQYQFFDNLELGLRALQKNIYETKGGEPSAINQEGKPNQEGATNCVESC